MTGFQRLLIASMLIACAITASRADIQVGNYIWEHKYDASAYTGVPSQNRYGGGYSHLDIAWTWTMESGHQRISNDWTTAADCLDDNPNWYAGHTGMQYAQWVVKNYYPSLWTRIKAHSDAGRYDAGELSWSEGYWSFGGDEYYLRNYYISTRFCQDNFGYLPLVASGYDLDDPCWTQPKIQTYITGRTEENPTGLGFCNRFTWNWGPADIWRPNGWTDYRWTSDDGSLVICGTKGIWSGDGGGAEICAPSAGRFSTFASKVYQANNWNTTVPNLWNDDQLASGSGFSLFFWGAKTCENRLLEAEKFGTFARQFGYAYPLHGDWYLYTVWGGFLRFNQHDVADAQGIPWQTGVSNTTNLNIQDNYQAALTVADTTLNRALSVISANVNTSGVGTSVIAYNALSWDRNDYVMVKTADLGFSSPIQVKTDDGTVVPSQVINDRGVSKLVFTARAVPSLGLRAYKVLNSAAAVTPGVTGATQATEIVLDNQFVTVKVNRTSGAITSMYDKVNAKEMTTGAGQQIATTTATPMGWESCCGDGYGHHSTDMLASLTYKTPVSVALVDSGPAVARIKIAYVENSVNWEHDIMLFDNVPVVNNLMSTTNLNNNNELVLNIPLNTAVSNGSKELIAGVAYGHHVYVNGNPGVSWPYHQQTPTQKWANVSNDAKNYGVALLENNTALRSTYGIGGTHDLRLVLITEKPSHWSGHWSKTNWELGWGYWGHAGDWNSGATQKGHEFNSPLIARVEPAHGGKIPTQYSFLRVEPANVVVTAVKKWESESPARNDSLTMQVRFYEVEGRNTDAIFRFPQNRSVNAWESKGNEYGVYGNQLPATVDAGTQKVTFTIGHNQIRSLKIQTPYASTPVWLQRFGGPLSSSSAMSGVTARLCNLKGQIIWQAGNEGPLRAALLKSAAPHQIYVLQYISDEGKLLTSKKICGADGMVRSTKFNP